ncbi:hypothetical protein [Flavobacterium piscis]|uniref:Uncharacterized protein n=1 Tax=Flavobacterium piscis TaxID=1114874 RepID=A0ABU1Y8P0_9FLAO|nr:hypothetical protein [Flavobacterium piscis]MDR7210602.1 hypothetical protein [Flavobacterium piscis]
MKSKQILFFATATDIEQIAKSIEKDFSIKYYEMGLFDKKSNISYDSVAEISNFGFPKIGDWNRDLRLMIIPKKMTLVVREVPQKNGGIKYAIDPLENQTSICFQFGGIYQEGILLGGSCGTSFLNDFSLAVFNGFSAKVKKSFKKIGTFYVGKEAEEKLRTGWRLVTNEKSPKEYDLALS